MLHESILKLYRRLRLDGYRKLFGAVQEREGSLSAMEAFSAESRRSRSLPSTAAFLSQMRPTRSMRWRARGMWKKSYPPQTGGRSG